MARAVTDHRRHWAIHLGSYGLGALALSLGLTLLLQDHTRMGSPGWQTAFSLGLGPDFWGVILVSCGATMLVSLAFGPRGDRFLGVAAVMVSAVIFLRATAAVIALEHPNASGTAPQFFCAVSLGYLAHGLLHLPTVTDRLQSWGRKLARR